MNKYTPITAHAQLVEALRRGLTVEINSKDNESAADYQAPSSGWLGGLSAVMIAADDPDSYAWQGFTFRAVGEHDLSSAKLEPEDTMAKYTLIHTQAELARAIELGLSLEKAVKPDGAFISDVSGWDAYLPGGALESCFYDWTFRAVGEHDLTPAKPDGAFISGFGGWDAYLPGGRVLELKTGEPLAVGEHDLSPDKPELLTNADLNPGDIVRRRGKKWRVQGIDDGDSTSGLLLLDVAEPEDAPDFVDTTFPVTRGSGRRPGSGTGYRWRWGGAGSAELVSRGEPGPAKPELKTEEPLAVGDLVRVARDWDDFGVVGPAYRARFLGVVGRIAKDDRGIDGTLGLSAPDGGPLNMDGALGLLWVNPAQLDRVEEQAAASAEPEDRPCAGLSEGVGAVEAPPAFHISVTIQADTPEGYAAVIETLARGIES